jgi:hypothetical protein
MLHLTVVPGVLISAQRLVVVAIYAELAMFYHCSIAE